LLTKFIVFDKLLRLKQISRRWVPRITNAESSRV